MNKKAVPREFPCPRHGVTASVSGYTDGEWWVNCNAGHHDLANDETVRMFVAWPDAPDPEADLRAALDAAQDEIRHLANQVEEWQDIANDRGKRVADLADRCGDLESEIRELTRQRDDARDLAIAAGAFDETGKPHALTREDLLAEQLCWERIGSRPPWMSEWQYNQCNCRLPKGHEPVDGPGTLDGHCCGTDPRQVLAEIQQRADAATPGPWEYHATDYGHSRTGEECSVSAIVIGDTVSIDRLDLNERYRDEGLRDAAFIAHSRADVPRLVAALLKVLDLLESRKHDNCEDGWYSCSQATDPWDGRPSCLDPDREGKPCDCGRDWLIEAANKTITEALGGGA